MEELTNSELTFIVIMSIWLIESVLGNIGVILVVFRDKKLRNPTDYLICNLAISDLFLAAIVLPIAIHDISHTDDFHEGEFMCKVVNGLPVFCIATSIFSLVAMSFDRVHVIVRKNAAVSSKYNIKRALLSVYTAAVILTIPTFVEYSVSEVYLNEDKGYSTFNDTDTTTVCIACGEYYHVCGNEDMQYAFSLANAVMLLLIIYLLPMLAMCKNYTQVLVFIFKNSRKVSPQDGQVAFTPTLAKKRMKIMKMLILITAVFFFCWLPYFVLLLMATAAAMFNNLPQMSNFTLNVTVKIYSWLQKITETDQSSNADSVINMVRLPLAIFSTSHNTLVYIAFNSTYRSGFRNLLLCRGPHHETTANSLSTKVTDVKTKPNRRNETLQIQSVSSNTNEAPNCSSRV